MAIIAQSADGVQHSFPDGTNPTVIDKVMKDYAVQNSAPATPPQSPAGGGLESFLRSAANAATFNLADPIAAAGDATIPLDSGSSNAPTWMQRYEQNRASQLARTTADTTAHPYISDAGQFAGSFLNPVLHALPIPKTLGGAALQGAGIGGGYSAGSAIQNRGDAGDVAKQGLLGATIGAPLGMASFGISNLLLKPKTTATDTATSYVQRLMGNQTPADLEQASQLAGNKPLTSAEAMGRPAQVGIGALARRSGTTADALAGEMSARSADAPQRILSDYAAASGINPAAANGDIEQLVEAGRQTAAPLYKQALSKGATWNSELEALSQRPVIQRAMASAAEDLRNAGKNPEAFGFTAQDPMTGKFIQQPRPTAEAWDLIKKNVTGSVDRNPFGQPLPDSVSPKNYNIGVAARSLTGALKRAIPGYGDALAASGDYLSTKAAFDRGQSMILDSRVTPAQLAVHVAGMNPAETEAFKGGIANKLFNLAQNGKINPKIFGAPSVQSKLATALGPNAATEFLGKIQIENGMANFARLRTPGAGSPSAEYLAEMAAQDGTSNVPGMLNFAHTAAKRGVTSAALETALGKTKDALAAYATRGMSEDARNQAGQMLIQPPDILAQMLRSYRPPAPSATQQAIGALPLRLFPGALSLIGSSAPALSGP